MRGSTVIDDSKWTQATLKVKHGGFGLMLVEENRI